eukprot:gnl/Dysnectes_brevis/479_a532_7312.p1 GENE.gnl/Dysnectes_brevis/479_a532_7312~~gnl/Dysnectes_brevis/479_a532_7312.p1  ORF type:complete len:166 (+),score=54.48 gnl/Dysnectes_brevis/479_a532_7312:43-540(+)
MDFLEAFDESPASPQTTSLDELAADDFAGMTEEEPTPEVKEPIEEEEVVEEHVNEPIEAEVVDTTPDDLFDEPVEKAPLNPVATRDATFAAARDAAIKAAKEYTAEFLASQDARNQERIATLATLSSDTSIKGETMWERVATLSSIENDTSSNVSRMREIILSLK